MMSYENGETNTFCQSLTNVFMAVTPYQPLSKGPSHGGDARFVIHGRSWKSRIATNVKIHVPKQFTVSPTIYCFHNTSNAVQKIMPHKVESLTCMCTCCFDKIHKSLWKYPSHNVCLFFFLTTRFLVNFRDMVNGKPLLRNFGDLGNGS